MLLEEKEEEDGEEEAGGGGGSEEGGGGGGGGSGRGELSNIKVEDLTSSVWNFSAQIADVSLGVLRK